MSEQKGVTLFFNVFIKEKHPALFIRYHIAKREALDSAAVLKKHVNKAMADVIDDIQKEGKEPTDKRITARMQHKIPPEIVEDAETKAAAFADIVNKGFELSMKDLEKLTPSVLEEIVQSNGGAGGGGGSSHTGRKSPKSRKNRRANKANHKSRRNN